MKKQQIQNSCYKFLDATSTLPGLTKASSKAKSTLETETLQRQNYFTDKSPNLKAVPS